MTPDPTLIPPSDGVTLSIIPQNEVPVECDPEEKP